MTKEETKQKALEIFKSFAPKWQGDAMLYPIKQEGKRNCMIRIEAMLEPIIKAIEETYD